MTPTSPLVRSAWLLLALAGLVLFPRPAAAWWDDHWTLRKKVTLDLGDTGVPIQGPIGPAAVLLRLHDGNFQFSAAKSDGSDLRFIAEDDHTPLPYHIEKYDSLLDEAFVWVGVRDLKGGEARSFWLYYGNAAAPPASDGKGTYDADTVLVYHFGEHGQPPRDYSGAGNQGGGPIAAADGAIIGAGARFDGRQTLQLPASPSLAWAADGPMTWEAWIKPATVGARAVVFSREDGDQGFAIGIDRGIPYLEVRDGGDLRRTASGKPILAGQWRHWAAVAAAGKIRLFLDGEPYAELDAALPALGTAAVFGGESPEAPSVAGNTFAGEMDEIELSKVARPPGAIRFAALNQGGDQTGKLLGLGEDEQKASWLSWLKTGYFGIILGSLSADGWAVICLLAVMGIISWAVMIRKALYLNSTAKGNATFMREWHHLSADLTALDGADSDKVKTLGGRVEGAALRHLRQSSVYRIYHIGAEEIRHRLATAGTGGAKYLSTRSIEAIRATLDSGMVRETHRLNSQLVLLTIAISGGPFLGLLGTVVGVMITFAAVAAAGDVNVNAIAPGIAAALAATVAGLAVAIPSLFGYNYLLTRVKDSISDMQVFVDEFIAKMAEFYSEPRG